MSGGASEASKGKQCKAMQSEAWHKGKPNASQKREQKK